MDVDSMVLVSIDDHVVEPPDMFRNTVPAKWAAEAPHVVRDAGGVDRWVYQGRTVGVSGLNAVVTWPAEEWGRDPAGFAEMRPAVYDVDDRVRDMDRNGILASIHRVAARGCRAITMPEQPHLEGLPSYHDLDHWGPVFQALSDTGVVMCLHIGTGFGALQMAPDAPIDNLIILACQISSLAAQDLLWGPAMRSYPDLRIAFSEGGIGWIPFYLDRCDRHYTNQRWLRRDFGGRLPSEVFRDHSLACYVTDPTSLKLRHDIGIDIIAWECDYPHADSIWPNAPELVLDELTGAGADDADIDRITWRNACRFFGWDPFASIPREQATVGALRAGATDVDTATTSRDEYARRYAARRSGSGGGVRG